MTSLAAVLPWWVVGLDYILGAIMWTLIGRAAMIIFLPVTSDFFFKRAFVMLTDPVLRVFRPVPPGFLIDPLVPLFVAWFLFLFRFYVLPWILGYSVLGMLSFPLEGEIAAILYDLFGGGLGGF
ncbi:MAG: hypothetical protein J4G15_14655 [Alphaproteobacteria bacterium]|nr:hypothetical protein [Alphaproteobacteria bacterium]